MLGFDCCSHFCSHPLATPKVRCFHGVPLGCSHFNNLGSDRNELLLLSTYGSYPRERIALRKLDLLCSQGLATKLATVTMAVAARARSPQ